MSYELYNDQKYEIYTHRRKGVVGSVFIEVYNGCEESPVFTKTNSWWPDSLMNSQWMKCTVCRFRYGT